MPIKVIERVNQLGKEKNQPTLLTFQYFHGHSTMDPDPYLQLVDVDIKGVIQNPNEQDLNLQDENNDDEHHDDTEDEVKHEQMNLDDSTEAIIENDEPIITQQPILGDIPDKQNEKVRKSTRTPFQRAPYEPSMTGKKYSETTATTLNQTTIHPDTHMQLNLGPYWYHVVHYAMTQLSTKSGLKRWGTKGSQAVSNELSQLHLRDTYRPINLRSLSKYYYNKGLDSHLFLKQKRDQTIKGRMVAGGN